MKTAVLKRVEWKASAAAPRPDVSFLPAMLRRRLSDVDRAALHVAWRIFRETDPEAPIPDIPVVFASRWGEIGLTLELMRQMQEEGEMSPAGFSMSVHNAAPGAWSLFTGSRAPYTAIAARERTYEMGLLESEAQILAGGVRRVLYVYAEESAPDFYMPEFGDGSPASAIAQLLAPATEV